MINRAMTIGRMIMSWFDFCSLDGTGQTAVRQGHTHAREHNIKIATRLNRSPLLPSVKSTSTLRDLVVYFNTKISSISRAHV